MDIRNLKNDRGFTLIELSVLVLILSFLLVPLFNYIHQQRAQKERIEVEAINERLLAALSVYLKSNGHFPCPANPALSYGDANFARQMDCSVIGGTVVQGDVPTYDLGIPYRLMFNVHDYKYLYAVTRVEAVPGSYTGGGAITVTIEDNFGATTTVNNVPFVVVNPGQDGKGVGGSFPCIVGPGAKDSENCDTDDTFYDALFSKKSNINDADYYDDIIFYDLAREESTFWDVMPNGANMDIVNRNSGNVGVGDFSGAIAPTEKFEVKGGDVKLEGGNVKAQGMVKAPEFYYEGP